MGWLDWDGSYSREKKKFKWDHGGEICELEKRDEKEGFLWGIESSSDLLPWLTNSGVAGHLTSLVH